MGVKKREVSVMLSSLDFYIKYAKSILNDLLIPYRECPIRIGKRTNARQLGKCHREWDRYTQKYNYDITLNPALFSNDVTDDNVIVEVLIHELIHTCDGAFCHTGMFTTYANKVNRKYHFNIGRTTSTNGTGVELPWKFKVVCMKCGKTVGTFSRRSAFIKAVECANGEDTDYSHRSCGCKKFKVIYNR